MPQRVHLTTKGVRNLFGLRLQGPKRLKLLDSAKVGFVGSFVFNGLSAFSVRSGFAVPQSWTSGQPGQSHDVQSSLISGNRKGFVQRSNKTHVSPFTCYRGQPQNFADARRSCRNFFSSRRISRVGWMETEACPSPARSRRRRSPLEGAPDAASRFDLGFRRASRQYRQANGH